MPFLSGRGLKGLTYTLFGALVLSALWVTSLSFLSAQSSATALLTDAGAQVLNPFLVDHGFGLSQSTYASLEAAAHAAPSQPLTFSVLKVRVLGREILGRDYTSTVRLVYGRVASTYYTDGAGAVFDVPPQLKQELPNFAIFNPDNIQVIPGGPTVSQLPPFLQPFFVFIGLTPATFTASGHERLLGMLPWFWIVAAVLGLLAVALNRSEKKLEGLAHAVIHSTWPIVAILVGVSVLANANPKAFASYSGVLGVIRGAFLPVYGTALVVGLLSLIGLKVLPPLLAARRRHQATAPVTARVGGEEAYPRAGVPPSMPPMPSAPPMGSPGQPEGMPPTQWMPSDEPRGTPGSMGPSDGSR